MIRMCLKQFTSRTFLIVENKIKVHLVCMKCDRDLKTQTLTSSLSEIFPWQNKME